MVFSEIEEVAMSKKFPDVKVLRIAKADRAALDRVAGAISGGNASKALRQLVKQADESLREHGIYERQRAARNSPEARGIEQKLLAFWAASDAEKAAKGKAGADETSEWDEKWGNKGPQDPATKRTGGPVEAGTYSERYGPDGPRR